MIAAECPTSRASFGCTYMAVGTGRQWPQCTSHFDLKGTFTCTRCEIDMEHGSGLTSHHVAVIMWQSCMILDHQVATCLGITI